MSNAGFKTWVINPHTQTIDEVEYSGDHEQIRALIECDLYDAARINRFGDSLFVDDEGLYKEQQSFFKYAGFPVPLAGKALLLGSDPETGETKPPSITGETLKEKVMWVLPIKVNDEVRWLDPDGGIHVFG